MKKVVLTVGLLILARMDCAAGDMGTELFDVRPRETLPASAVTVKWDLPAHTPAYITYVGLVTGRDMCSIRVAETTTFSLIMQIGGAVRTEDIRVVVKGGRGAADYPNDDQFRFPRRYGTDAAFEKVLNVVGRVLQNEMGFSVRQYRIKGETRFVTNLSQRAVGTPQFRFRSRRIAYLVVVDDPLDLKQTALEISTLVEYQLRVESTWRIDAADQVHRAQAEQLAARIRSLVHLF